MLMMQEKALDLRARLERLQQVDWDFAASGSQSLFSSLHFHPCRYPSQVPAVVIGALTSVGETVLDPFIGSGTTAVEAQRLGRACVGIEVNPVAVLVARAKTISRSANHIRKLVDRVRLGANQSAKRAVIPASVQAAKWYTERTIRELRRLRHYLDTLSGEARVIADTAFSAILLPVCRETRHWGYVCDNTNPKGTYERDVYETFERTLASFVEAYAERQAYWQAASGQPVVAPNVKIHEGDARNILLDMPPESAHLIVTSPPYFGVADYVKAQRLTLEWFGKDIEPLRLEEIGARSKRHRITAADDYLSECKQVFEGCRHVLKKDRACVVIFGESNERKPMHSMFVSIMEECGFQLRYSAPRKISARRRLTPQLQVEYLLVFT